ncbi:MAG: insulinase family protein [Novosphingobium sp.]
MQRFITAMLSLALVGCAAQPGAPIASTPTSAATQPAALESLVAAVDIPYQKFTLANGLTVLVHTDRKAPIVGVTVYYRVGSKHEPKGKTGFAHLYEHLFFGGSANVPSFDVPLEAAGSTTTNGSTWYDRTNYVETVPTGALDLALFMESDRMGHLLPAVTQDKLDKQRGVVQNEKRQGDNQPYGLMQYAIGDGLFPVGHPYRHTTIGSMADLDAATLGDVRGWFRDNYAPNNVVLALAGDIDASTARPLVEKWFGDIPPGPAVRPVQAGPVTLAAPVKREMTDQVPVLRLTRNWSGPGVNDADAVALNIGMRILGGLSSSRLDNALVRVEKLAVLVTAESEQHEQIAMLQAQMDVRPGVARAQAEQRFDAVIARFVNEGPSADELRRAVTSAVSDEIGSLEDVGGFSGKGATLAEGQLYSGDPEKYKKDLAAIVALTPGDVRAALQRWLTRPTFALDVVPGARIEDGAKLGGWDDNAVGATPAPDPRAPAPPIAAGQKRPAPPVLPVGELAFPVQEHARLANGIPVTLARRTAIPKVEVSLSFDAGYAADALDTPGTQGLMLAMLDEGTTTRDSKAIAEEQERLGARIAAAGSLDASRVAMSALSANLAPSLALMADVARNPAFAEGEVARVRDQRLAALAQTLAQPSALASRELNRALFGAHPYAQPGDGLGDATSLRALTAPALRVAHEQWLRPDIAEITVVGDVTMATLLPMLERTFGDWRAPSRPRPVKDIAGPPPPAAARLVVIDRPGSPQTVIYAGRVLPVTGRTPGLERLDLANEVIGGGFLSRLNLDLREEKGWTYGVSSRVRQPVGPRSLVVAAPVQADKTGAAIRQIIADMKAFPTARPVEPAELDRVTDGNIRGLPNRFESNAEVVAAILANRQLGRPDDYYSTLPARYRAIDAGAIDNAARTWLQPEALTVVVVGDRKAIEPQLAGLGMPVEFRGAAATD